MVAVPAPRSLSNIVLDKRGPGTATIHVTFQDGGAGKFKSEKSPLETPICGLRSKDSLFCYASESIILLCIILGATILDPYKFRNIVAGKW